MAIVLPPNEVFEFTPNYEQPVNAERARGYEGSKWVKTVCSKEGGMYMFQEGLPFPRKGHAYLEAILANNQVKRWTLAMLNPFTCKEMRLPLLMFVFQPFKIIPFLEKILVHYCRMSVSIYRSVHPIPFLKEEFYKNSGRELGKLISYFLMGIGITEVTANSSGKMGTMMIEYDDYYQYVMEDLFSITSQELMLKNPRKEFLKILEIYKQRQPGSERLIVGGKVTLLIKTLTLLLFIPKVKRAFKNAVSKVNFPKLQLDDADTFFCLTSGNAYYFLGKSREQRRELILNQAEEDFKKSLIK